MNHEYRALVARETETGVICGIEECRIDDLPSGELLIRVHYSSLNYKDALSASGNRGVTKKYPHTPGIDAAGIVVESNSASFSEGEEVIITGFDFGMNTPGGFGEYIRVPAEWALKLPSGLSMKEAMILGTAGLTAGMSVYQLSRFVRPEDGDIAVSGATGGVGSLSLGVLKKAGYRSLAVTGKPENGEYLRSIGAAGIIPRAELEAGEGKSMLKPRFAGGIDTVGGRILQSMLKSVKPLGAVTCCGNASSDRLEMTVYPFILRGISLTGIDSQNCPVELRESVWNKLADEWRPESLMNIYDEIGLEELPDRIKKMLEGGSRGRVLIRHSPDHSTAG